MTTNRTITELYQALRPLLLRDVAIAASGSRASSGGMETHALNSNWHTGQLAETQAPWAATKNEWATALATHAALVDVHHAAVTAGTLISLSGQQVSVAPGAAYQFIGTGGDTVPEWRNVSELAGNGLTATNGVLAVGAGALITVGADTVGITAGANYQYIGTGSGTAAAWQNLSTLAGNGLTHSAGVLAVGVSGLGLSVGADAVTLTSSSNPGAAASILASSAAGLVQLVQVASNATFASGFAGSGYRVDYGVTEASKASAEFDNLTVRGRMRVYELLIQQIRATNGSVFVTSTGKAKVVTASTNPTWTVNGDALTFDGDAATLATALYTITTSDSTEDAASKSLYHGFLTGDLIRAQQTEWNGSAFAGVYQSDLEVTGVTDLYTFVGARVSSGTSAAAVGYDYARLGSATDSTRRGTIYLTSDDSNAPFIDILDGVQAHSGWNASGNVKVRLGKLSGISDAYFGALSGYGLYSDNVYLRGSIYATDGIFNGTVYATDGIFSGTVYASAGTFTGTVTASAGTIGGWTIASGRLTNDTGTAATSAGLSPADYPFYAGQTYANRATAPFRVTPAGALTATSGAVGGWTLGATALTAGSGSNTVGLDAGGTNPAIYAGSATPGSAPFRVTQAGALYAEGADIRGAITASSGSITGALTIGTSGEIRQGTGTLGTNFTGLRVMQSSSIGQVAVYDANVKTMRISSDDVRYKMATTFTDIRTIKWLEDTDYAGTWSDLSSANGNYAYIGAYYTSTNSYLYLSNRVNNTGSPANTRHSQISMIASRNESGTVYSKGLQLVTFNSTYNYDGIAFLSMALQMSPVATPTYGLNSSGDAQIYLKGGNLVLRYNDGGTYRYKYLNLAGTGTSWTHSTTAP